MDPDCFALWILLFRARRNFSLSSPGACSEASSSQGQLIVVSSSYVDFTWKGCGSLSCHEIYVHKAHSSCELMEVVKDLTLHLCLFCRGCWDEFKQFCQQIDLVIWEFFTWEGFFMCFLFASILCLIDSSVRSFCALCGFCLLRCFFKLSLPFYCNIMGVVEYTFVLFYWFILSIS